MTDTITLPRATVQQVLKTLEDLGMRHFENTGEKLYADIYIALRTALEQQAEPVEGNTVLKAFLAAAKEAGVTHLQQAEPVCPDCKAAVLYECVACSSNNYPPQRKPLTDEEIDYWIGSNSTKKALARAIEAAHGIKEGT